jgi:hypothetical protein
LGSHRLRVTNTGHGKESPPLIVRLVLVGESEVP